MTLPTVTDDDRPNRVPWPPIIDVGVLLAAWLLEQAVPLSMMMTSAPVRLAGWFGVAAGLAIAAAGLGYFQVIGTTSNPTGRAARLARGGIYAWTRNPMYLGTVIAFVGLAFALGSAWLVILAILMPLPLRKLAIEREEAYLGRRFGVEYADYCKKVRRWL